MYLSCQKSLLFTLFSWTRHRMIYGPSTAQLICQQQRPVSVTKRQQPLVDALSRRRPACAQSQPVVGSRASLTQICLLVTSAPYLHPAAGQTVDYDATSKKKRKTALGNLHLHWSNRDRSCSVLTDEEELLFRARSKCIPPMREPTKYRTPSQISLQVEWVAYQCWPRFLAEY